MSPPLSAVSDMVTDDAALGGRLHLLQPRRGHRFGHDAILLAAAVPAKAGQYAVDLGAGVGVAGLALATRIAGVSLALVEIDPALSELARENAARNAMAERVTLVTLDVGASAAAFEQAGLKTASADHVLMNPPFNDAVRAQASPNSARRTAHVAEAGSIGLWVDAAARLLKPGGMLTLIYRAEARDEIIAALANEFESARVLPIYPKPGAAAIRIVVQAVRTRPDQRRRPAEILRSPGAEEPPRGLLLNGADGRPTSDAEAILRHAAPLTING